MAMASSRASDMEPHSSLGSACKDTSSSPSDVSFEANSTECQIFLSELEQVVHETGTVLPNKCRASFKNLWLSSINVYG